MDSRSEPSDLQPQKEKRDERRKIIIALLFLLLSCGCIFCSSQSALWFINRDYVETSMRSNLRADYGFDPALALAPLSENIITEANQDEAALLAKQTPIAVGLGVVVLPNPVPTPAPTVIALLPTPTFTPTVPAAPNPAPVTPVAPTATSIPPATALPPPTSQPPTSPPPTSLPPTVPPTVSLPTLPPPTIPPTVPPATIPPPTVPPTSVPPTTPPTTSPPTATATSIPSTATPVTPTPLTVAFSAAIFNVNENTSNAVITAILNATSSQTVTVNFAATSGTATAGSDFNPVSGILTFAPGQVSQTFNVTIINDTLANEGNETVALSLSNPTNAALGLSNATLTIIDDEGPLTVQFSQSSYTIGEAGGTVSIDVTLSATSALTVSVNYATGGGTATAGSDYGSTSGTLTFAPGQLNQSFNVPIINDTLDEIDETVNLTLSTAVNASLGTPNPATLTILDDDAPPSVQFSNPTYTVNEADGTASIDVTLSAASGVTVTVDYATSDLTATAGSDYGSTSGTLTFAPGQLNQTFNIPIINDTLDEIDETVGLTLSSAVNASLGTPNPAALTIVDDDAQPSVQFSSGTYSVNEAGGTASIDVTLSAVSAVTVTVNYATSGNSATPGADYQDTSGTLIFAPGQLNQTFNIPIINDTLDEPDETVSLTLSSAVNASLGTPNPAVLTIVDDDAPPSVQFSTNSYSVNEGAGTASIDVTLSAASGITVTVDYATSDLIATAGSDYTAIVGQSLTFPPGSTSQTFPVTINDDSLDEPDETIQLTLSNANNAALGTPANAILTIVDNDTPATCPGLYPTGEPNVGAPDGNFARIACDVGMIIDMGATPVNTSGDGNFDLVYYELKAFPPQTPPEQILMDLVTVEVGQSPTGPWYQVFNWGDGGPDTNTSVGQAGYATESDNLLIPMTTPPLYGTTPYTTGVAIDVDAFAPSGSYRYVRIFSPLGGNNDGPEVDAVQALP